MNFRHKHIFLLPGLLVLIGILIFPILLPSGSVCRAGTVSIPVWILLVLKTTSDCSPKTNVFGNLFPAGSFLSLTTVFLQYVLGFSLALMVWRDLASSGFSGAVLIPMMTTPVIMTVIWKTVFHELLGPVNDFLSLFEITPLWLSDETLAKVTVVIVETWQWTPFMFLLLLAGLLSLPEEAFLAASIDGAGPICKFIYVTFR